MIIKNIFLAACIICLSISISIAQETEDIKDNIKKQESLLIKVKGDVEPDVYIDGKKYDYTIIELLDQSKIESIDVIKGEKAIKEYDAPNGVINIKTKQKIDSTKKIEIKATNNLSGKDPVIIIDGKVADKETLAKMSADDIYSINVIKGEDAIKEYDAPNGAVIITTKKGKKQKPE